MPISPLTWHMLWKISHNEAKVIIQEIDLIMEDLSDEINIRYEVYPKSNHRLYNKKSRQL